MENKQANSDNTAFFFLSSDRPHRKCPHAFCILPSALKKLANVFRQVTFWLILLSKPMKAVFFLVAAMLSLRGFLPSTRAATNPTTLDLLGNWEAPVVFGKFKFRMVLRVEKTPEGGLGVTMDLPDQGQKALPVAAILFNSPDVRIEVDQFQTAYNGKLSEDLSAITGEFEEGPGGRPFAANFKRLRGEQPETPGTFTFEPGEPRDIRGHWKTSIEPGPGISLTIALNIGRLPDGTFNAKMDVLEQAAKGIPASSVVVSNNQVNLKWDLLQITINGKLSEDGNRIEGEWKQRQPINTTFTRLDAPASLEVKNVSYEPDPNKPDDIRGQWAGRLELPQQKLRIIIKVGKTPDGAFAGTLASPDQGGGELPMTGGSFTAPKAMLEWKGISGKFEGTLTNNGSVLNGTWEQGGMKMPLKLERSTTTNNKKQ